MKESSAVPPPIQKTIIYSNFLSCSLKVVGIIPSFIFKVLEEVETYLS